MLQGLHFIWSVGATVGPLVVSHFLVDLSRSRTNFYTSCSHSDLSNGTTDIVVPPSLPGLETNSTGNGIDVPVDVPINVTLNTSVVITTDYNTTLGPDSPSPPELDYIRWAYIIIGCVVLIPSVMFLIAFIINRPYIARLKVRRRSEVEDDTDTTTPVSSSKKYTFIMMVFMFVFYFAFSFVEVTPGNFLSAFVVKELCWENKQGARLISILWGSHGIGRICGVPLSIFLSPRTMLIGDLCMQLLAYILMLFVRHHSLIMWVSTAFAGLGMATVMGTGFLWAADHVQITGRVSSVFFVASSLGSTLNPIIVGYLFDNHSPVWVIYVGLIAALVMAFDFFAVNLFTYYVGRLDDRNRPVHSPSPAELESLR